MTVEEILQQLRDEIQWTDDEPTEADLAEYLEEILAVYKLVSEWSGLRWLPDERVTVESSDRVRELEDEIGLKFGDLRRPGK